MNIVVALHETLGHGTGKLLIKDAQSGKLNFPSDLINPLTGKLIDKFYLSTESYK